MRGDDAHRGDVTTRQQTGHGGQVSPHRPAPARSGQLALREQQDYQRERHEQDDPGHVKQQRRRAERQALPGPVDQPGVRLAVFVEQHADWDAKQEPADRVARLAPCNDQTGRRDGQVGDHLARVRGHVLPGQHRQRHQRHGEQQGQQRDRRRECGQRQTWPRYRLTRPHAW